MADAPKRHAGRARARARDFPWGPPVRWFALGLLCRLLAFPIPHDEGDEIAYRALVHQLEDGRGYTLQGTALIDHGWPADQYGHALFFHPPGGIALFWLLDRMFGATGFPLAQLLSYALFFWSMMWLARAFPPSEATSPEARGVRLHVVAALAAFTPLMSHVTARYWLDGPMLALVTLSAALFTRAMGTREARGAGGGWAIAAGLAIGSASWVKTAALVAVPGILLLGWAMAGPDSRRHVRRLAMIFTGVALIVQLPWELWQWRVLGSPFPAWAGRPSAQLVAISPYVRRLTIDRPGWIYLTLTPRVVWTLVPSLAIMLAARLDPRTRRIGLALVAWAAIVLATVIGLGAIGYSKLLRYAILVTPATVLLFALMAGAIWREATSPERSGFERFRARLLAVVAGSALALEIAQGLYTPLIDRRDLIWPLVWRGNGLF